jgi:hypothetical protein
MTDSLADKVAHVRQARQARGHTCHWPGCSKAVPPAKWGCPEHWFKLPFALRNRIWRAYQAGQEDNAAVGGPGGPMPSREYVEAANAVQAWIKAHLERAKVDRRQKELW